MKSAESLHVAHYDQGLPRPDGSHERHGSLTVNVSHGLNQVDDDHLLGLVEAVSLLDG